jgi:isopenicillin N synthase-like dioxygenase
VNHYLSQPDPPAPGRVRQKPHTDMGGLTLLWADDSPGGLEVQRRREDALSAPPEDPSGALEVQRRREDALSAPPEDPSGALEATIGPEGDWVPVRFPPGAMLLQAGDLLRLWTHGRIPANNHRVVNPPREPGVRQTDRYSVVFFHHPDLDTWVAPAATSTAAPAGEAGLPGVGAREHVLARQRAAYTAG